MDLRNLKLKTKFESVLSFRELERCYTSLVERLNIDSTVEQSKTKSEDLVFDQLKKGTGIKFYRSLWIGKRNIDIFCPCLSGVAKDRSETVFRGLAIEVDGEIHNHQFKMNRDNSKYELLHKLEIALFTIDNNDLKEQSFRSFLNEVKNFKRLDSRGRKRVWRNIYLFTIASHLEHFVVKNHLSIDQISTLKEIRGMK